MFLFSFLWTWLVTFVASLSTQPKHCFRRVGAITCAALILLATSGAEAAYVQVYNTIQKGAITFTGNTLALNGNGTAQSGVPGTSSTGGAFIAEGISPLSYFGGFNATFYGLGAVGTTNDWTKNASRAVLNIPVGATEIGRAHV